MHSLSSQLNCVALRYSYPMFQRLTRPHFDHSFLIQLGKPRVVPYEEYVCLQLPSGIAAYYHQATKKSAP